MFSAFLRQRENAKENRARMQRLERFGVGDFNEEEVREKTAFIKAMMEKRPKATAPLFSVVVPAYREEKYILATLLSLAEQSQTNCEFLIVTNGEPEGNLTEKIAEASGFWVMNDPIGGIARARQTGLKAARGEIIVTTDADSVHSKEWLDCIGEIMADESVVCGAGLMRSLSKSFLVRCMQSIIAFSMWGKNALHPKAVTGVSEANSFYRRKAALDSGGYDLATRVGEGMTLFRQLQKPGLPFIYTNDELIIGTSGRRQERVGAIRWFLVAMWNTTLQIFGKKGVDVDTYPDIR